MKIYSIYILNKAGGLIYQADLNPGLSKLSVNDYLVLAGTLHGVHAIATRLRPEEAQSTHDDPATINSSIISTGKANTPDSNRLGLQSIETDYFSLYVFQTLTGIKFFIITSPAKPVDQVAPASSSDRSLKKQLDVASDIFKKIYLYYCDYVMKDPFYSLDMPIKSPVFEAKVKGLAKA
ncbi:CIC11C00000002570 [Sungouiella intermedia]|uniref:Trafficking protein particle complex subunit n=1 Tax=Sungouiella intermedia TaxID=45354 RepID=A0A1L0BAS4_9ASCO|nr:CIC11C00000003722 [[Candida] intermedia]SGZ52495.1 CIC11C00000002570 [[Candida] intermedia]